MGDLKLTKDSDVLICVLYKTYLQKKKEGISKTIAKSFGSSYHIQETLIPTWSKEDVDETCWELVRAGLLTCNPGNNRAVACFLNDPAIEYMENRFPRGLEQILDTLSKLKDAIPFA